MVRKRIMALVALALAASLALLGCNDDPNNNGTNNGNNGETDAGDVQDDTDEGDAEEDTGNDADDGCQSDDDCTGDMTCNMSTGECEMPPSGCDVDPPPARCEEDPTTKDDWASASVIATLEIPGWTDDNTNGEFDQGEFTEDCCYDFDGDGDPDNGLGKLLADFGGFLGLPLPEANVTLQEAIDDGSLTIIFEHEGLEDLAGDDFDINFLLGELDGIDTITTDGSATNPVLIDPQSFDEGSFPQARIPNATLADDGSVTAGPGNARLQLELLGATINLAIRQAQVNAMVPETPASDLEDQGVFLMEGELGGFTTVADLFDALNTFAETCTCLGIPDGEQLISYDPNDPLNGETTSCNSTAEDNADSCTGDQDTCGTIASNCGLVTQVGGGLADLDTDGDGAPDAISIALKFTAAGANITGTVSSGQ